MIIYHSDIFGWVFSQLPHTAFIQFPFPFLVDVYIRFSQSIITFNWMIVELDIGYTVLLVSDVIWWLFNDDEFNSCFPNKPNTGPKNHLRQNTQIIWNSQTKKNFHTIDEHCHHWQMDRLVSSNNSSVMVEVMRIGTILPNIELHWTRETRQVFIEVFSENFNFQRICVEKGFHRWHSINYRNI